MGVKNRTLDIDARIRRGISKVIDMSSDTRQHSVVAFDPDRRIKIEFAYVVFAVDGDTAAVQAIQVGIQGDLAKYGTLTHNVVAATNQAGDTEKIVVLNPSVYVAKGVPVLVTRAAGASTNIGELQVVVGYSVDDRAS